MRDGESQIVIVSEYVSDGSLKTWMEKQGGRAQSVEIASTLIIEILAGLEHLHSRGIVHRDLKPANVLLQGMTPRLADFGISRVLKTKHQYTVPSGTILYMSPEALRGKVIKSSDIWAVGVMLYELLSGDLPFRQDNLPDLIMAINSDDPEPPTTSIPAPFDEIITRALRKEPTQRYATAADMAAAIKDALTEYTRHLKPLPPPDSGWSSVGDLYVRVNTQFDHAAYAAFDDPVIQFLVSMEMKPKANASQGIGADIFLILDVSGSMDSSDRYPLLRRAVQEFLSHVETDDRVGIAIFSTDVDVILSPSLGADTDVWTHLKK